MSFNLDILRLQYEVYGLSLQTIAASNGIAVKDIEDFIKDYAWSRNPQIADTTELAEITEDYVGELKEKLNLVSLLKQEILNPVYTKLETLLVQRAIDLLSDTEVGPKELQILTTVLRDLLSHNANITAIQSALDNTDSKLVVQIMNKVENNS